MQPARRAYPPRSKPPPRKVEPALVGYLTAGFPTRAQFQENLAAVAGACDVVEIGVPFSDPMADGATIQRASFAALENGVTLPWILEELGRCLARRAHAADELLESVAGVRNGRAAARRGGGGVAGFIVPDLPFEESGDLKAALATRRPGAGANGDAGDAAGTPERCCAGMPRASYTP